MGVSGKIKLEIMNKEEGRENGLILLRV